MSGNCLNRRPVASGLSCGFAMPTYRNLLRRYNIGMLKSTYLVNLYSLLPLVGLVMQFGCTWVLKLDKDTCEKP